MPVTITYRKKNPFPEIPDPLGYGQRAVDYLRSLKHPKSKSGFFRVDPWQEWIVRSTYGPVDDDGHRIVRRVYLLVPKGNRKTTLTAGLALLHGRGPEKIPGTYLCSVASEQKQAKLVFQEVCDIMGHKKIIGHRSRQTDIELRAEVRDYQNRIRFEDGIIYHAINSDGGSNDGQTPQLVIADEIHQWSKRDPRKLWGVLTNGLDKTDNTLLIVTTTAGRGQNNLAFDEISYARKVASGVIHDPSTLAVLYEAPKDADWRDEKIIRSVNPGLDYGYPSWKGIENTIRQIEHKPHEVSEFKRYRLNIWQDQSADPFVDMDVYNKGNTPVDLEALKDKPCWLAVDLSSNADLTVIVACWLVDDNYIVHPWFFCPKDNLEKRQVKDRVPYVEWAEQGYIIPTDGNVVDFRAVENTIRDLCEEYDVREVAFDPHLARNVLQNLIEDGYPAVQMRQVPSLLMPAIKELEHAILGGRFIHGGHPILRWNFANVHVERKNGSHINRFYKRHENDKIDGAVAAAMAVYRAFAGNDAIEKSIYATDERAEGLLVF